MKLKLKNFEKIIEVLRKATKDAILKMAKRLGARRYKDRDHFTKNVEKT